ncbi:hypothetical protein [Lysinibacter cavernae]|uniref:Uncharacterized protein n=1 Tax=Lysinibacter cavernae TaxID=1640652 RepID=A0A7X5QZ54_9MICO|nr:hypothetical protein [Lysinibacter cavernae]NIH52683.1 hypothetical protein [Lysinibacter cavernae]
MTVDSPRSKRIPVLIIVAVILGALVFLGFSNKQAIEDQFTIWGFTPTAEVTAVQNRLQLTGEGTTAFLASAPTLESSQRFNEQCLNVDHSDEGHVLGCFTGSRIHLFKVDDERLDGIVEVTAAHELLHATYSRLSAGEQEQVNNELEAEYERLKPEHPEIEERMQVYANLPHASFVNELHSVLGTEVADLSPELEEHYAKYFTSRSVILDLFESYHSVFTAIQSEATDIEAQMKELGDSIESRSATYQTDVTQLNADILSFNERAAAGDFRTATQFASEKAPLEERRVALETTRAQLETDVETYNGLRDRLLELDAKSQELNRVINSGLAPAPEIEDGD